MLNQNLPLKSVAWTVLCDQGVHFPYPGYTLNVANVVTMRRGLYEGSGDTCGSVKLDPTLMAFFVLCNGGNMTAHLTTISYLYISSTLVVLNYRARRMKLELTSSTAL